MTNPNAAPGAATGGASAAASSSPAPASAPATSGAPANPGAAPNSGDTDTGSGNRDAWITPEVKKAMEFDPFTPAGDELNPTDPAKTEGGSPTEGEVVSQPASPQPAQPQAPAASQPAQSAEAQRIAELTAERDRLLNAVLSGQKPSGSQPTQPEAGQDDDPLAFMPDYSFQLHDQLIAQMASENPAERKVAIGALVKGIAQGIHATVMQQVRKSNETLSRTISDQAYGKLTMAQHAQQVNTEFYTKYPQFKGIANFVRDVAHEMILAEGQGFKGWNETFRDKVGAEVAKRVAATVTTPGAPQSVPAGNPPAPAMFGGNGGGSGRPAPKAKMTQQDHMDNIF